MKNHFTLPEESPAKIFTLRESAFAKDLFIAAVSHFNLIPLLDESPSDIDTICGSLGIKPRPADVMLTLFKAYGLIREKRGIYYLTDTARVYLTENSDFNLSSYVSTLKEGPVCSDMVKVLKTGKPAKWASSKSGKQWEVSMEDPAFAESFTAGMNSRGAYLASALLKAIDLHGYTHMLDIGGASGIYSWVLLGEYRDLRAAVFEKPPVDIVARYSMNKFGMADRADIVTGDMFNDSFPKGYDIHFISHVLHDWDIGDVKKVIKNSFDTLDSGGKIILHDAHINRNKTGPVSVAEYSVLLMFLSQGKCYSVTEMRILLEKTGFKNVEYKRTILNRSIITATK